VTDGESGESVELVEEVPLIIGESKLERLIIIIKIIIIIRVIICSINFCLSPRELLPRFKK